MSNQRPTIGVVGGTGALGGGLAFRLARAGYPVVVGSRSTDKAVSAAQEIAATGENLAVRGCDNAATAAAADIVVVTVPFSHQDMILGEIKDHVAGKIVVDTTVPLVPPKVGTVQLPPSGSAALRAEEVLGSEVTVVSAFHNVAADKLRGDKTIDCDVLVFGNKRAARDSVVALVNAIGMRGIHGGPLANSIAAEALTSVLITINKRYKVPGAGIRITGDLIEPDAD